MDECGRGHHTKLNSFLNKMFLLWRDSLGTQKIDFGLICRKPQAAAASREGRASVTEDINKEVKLWSVSDGTLLRTFQGHKGEVNRVAFSPSGSQLATVSYDTTAKLWNVSDGTLLRTFEGHDEPVFRVAFSPSGSQLATGSMDETVKLWDVNVGSLVCTFHLGVESTSLKFSPDGLLLAMSRGYYCHLQDLRPLMPPTKSTAVNDSPTGPDKLVADQHAWLQLSGFLSNNPRRIKRLVNVYGIARHLATAVAAPSLLKFLILCEQWPLRTSWMLQAISENQKHGRWCGGRASETAFEAEMDLEKVYELVEPFVYHDTLWSAGGGVSGGGVGTDADPEMFHALMASEPRLTVGDVGDFSRRGPGMLHCAAINLNPALREHVAKVATQRVPDQPAESVQQQLKASLQSQAFESVVLHRHRQRLQKASGEARLAGAPQPAAGGASSPHLGNSNSSLGSLGSAQPRQ